jgi:glycine hydroxymethyltransferase
MDFVSKVHEIGSLLEKHSAFRSDCLNLIASENTPSPLVERLLSEELNRRYGYYTGIDLHQRAYRGNRFIVQIEEAAHELAKQLFGAAYVDLRPLSGNIAGIAAAFALGSPGDSALEVHNAHRYAHKLASSFLKVELQSISIPWDGLTYNIDLDRTVSLIQQHRPKLVIIGSALFLFPQPVRELKAAMRKYSPDSYLIYDAAHVMGLIAGGRFQSPLNEGADVVVTSTHKTLAGPQGGIILTNDQSLAEQIGPAVAPLLESNHHLGRLPALAGTFLEWMACGGEHADAIIRNAKALGQALHQRGIRLLGQELGFTESHTLIPIVDEFGESKAMADQLEACNIIAGGASVPPELGAHGLRIGVQEVTRRGMTAADVPEVADCIVGALKGDDLEAVKRQATALAGRFNGMRFTLKGV